MLCLRPEPCIVCKRSRRRKAASAVDDRILPLLSFAKYSDRLGLRQTSAFTRRIDDRVCLYGRDMSPFPASRVSDRYCSLYFANIGKSLLPGTGDRRM